MFGFQLRRTATPPPTTASAEFKPADSRRIGDAGRQLFFATLFWIYGAWALVVAVTRPSVLAGVAALVLLEVGLAAARVAAATGRMVDDPSVGARVGPALEYVCRAANCQVPVVALRDDAIRSAAVRARRRAYPLLILSRKYVQQLDDSELRAILAHEVVHITRKDLSAARRRSAVAALVGVLFGLLSLILAHDGFVDLPVWMAAYIVGALATTYLLAPLNRRRELRADREGTALAGDAMAMVGALQKAYALSREVRRQIFGRPPTSWLLSPLSWTLPTHPRLAKRLAQLREG
jgi:heat shock protein HtpX